MNRRQFLFTAAASARTQTDREGTLWLRPATPHRALTWGRKDGLVFGLPSDGGLPGPRGLIRVGIYNQQTGKSELINFIAIEPVIVGRGTRYSRRGLSELEMSRLDSGVRGKRLWVSEQSGAMAGVDQLSVKIAVEPFDNGASVYVLATMFSDRPNELALSVHAADTSAAIAELTLTATMGNYARLRQLWLKDRIVDSRSLFAGKPGNADGFIEGPDYPLKEMLRYGDGDAIALATTDEERPGDIKVPHSEWWTYRSVKLTQYWRVPARHIEPNLRVHVNGRRIYWGSAKTVPNGIEVPNGTAFENFELRQRYVPGQVFVYGVSRNEPWGFRPAIPRLAQRPKPI